MNLPGRPFPARAEPSAQRLPKDEDEDDRLYIARDIAARAIDLGGVTSDHDRYRRRSDSLEPPMLEWVIAVVILGETGPTPKAQYQTEHLFVSEG